MLSSYCVSFALRLAMMLWISSSRDGFVDQIQHPFVQRVDAACQQVDFLRTAIYADGSPMVAFMSVRYVDTSSARKRFNARTTAPCRASSSTVMESLQCFVP